MATQAETTSAKAENNPTLTESSRGELREAVNGERQKPLTSFDVNPDDATPMMRQFIEVKRDYPGVLLFYQMGEFYETFFEDALTAARVLEITLTARDAGKLGKVPMAGVPITKAEPYISRLLQKNLKVAICEQVEDPAEAKGLVKRAVTRVLSQGTITEETLLKRNEHNFLAAVSVPSRSNQPYGLAYCDITTGTFRCAQVNEAQLLSELDRLRPSEILAAQLKQRAPQLSGLFDGVDEWITNLPESVRLNYQCTPVPPEQFKLDVAQKKLAEVLESHDIDGTGLRELPEALQAAGAIGAYLTHHFPQDAPRFERVETYTLDDAVMLNVAARKNLELLSTVKTQQYEGSLCWVLDNTHTNMGGRLIRQWISQPTTNRAEINRRLDGVEALVNHADTRNTLNELLPHIYDLERLSIKVANCSASPRDLIALKRSIEQLPAISNALKSMDTPYLTPLHELPTELFRLMALIDQAIADSPPIGLLEGGILKTGYNLELDDLRAILEEQETWLDNYQAQEREATGIKTLKLGFNNAFGYFIEMSRNQSHQAPEHYHRKQTLTQVERFTTPILKEQEAKVLDAQSRQYQLEYSLYVDLRNHLRSFAPALQTVARQLAVLDVLQSFAHVAAKRNYTKPMVDDSLQLQLQDARHPVVEATTPMGQFVANHTHLSALETDHPIIPQLMLITGPNMSGKSTYMRQVAIIALMAQMGSFVPASYARIGFIDRIFTRIGAMDDLSSGQSTFMVEMHETAQILHGASQRSLVILDEVGRGTSTSDGIAIARSVIEYLIEPIGCRTLFATHYHELNDMEAQFPAIQNVRVKVAETETPSGLHVEFLHKVEPGTAQKSYGVHVAKMAGLPPRVIQRSERLMRQYEGHPTSGASKHAKHHAQKAEALPPQLQLFE